MCKLFYLIFIFVLSANFAHADRIEIAIIEGELPIANVYYAAELKKIDKSKSKKILQLFKKLHTTIKPTSEVSKNTWTFIYRQTDTEGKVVEYELIYNEYKNIPCKLLKVFGLTAHN